MTHLSDTKTPRQWRMECCDECKKLEGEGPWRCRCGREMPEEASHLYGWVMTCCGPCRDELTEEFTPGEPPVEEDEVVR